MSGLSEQIAVLDGVAALDPNDGRIGQQRARVDQYGRAVAPGVLSRRNVLDASAGANYSGGSSYAPGLPLMPSTVGLAGFGSLPGVLPPRISVIDASGGANYSGGSSYSPGLPLLPSNAGLAQMSNGYGRAGLGQANGYGRAGLGQSEYGRAGLGRLAGSNADADLLVAAEVVEMRRAPAPPPPPYKAPQMPLDPSDGRIGQYRATPTQYARQIAPGVLSRRNVLDASAGANYSGGSSYAPGLPLLPSTVGLAGLDAAPDAKLGIAGALKKRIGKDVVLNLKKKILGIERIWAAATPDQKDQLFGQYRDSVNTLLMHLSGVRQMRMKALMLKKAGVKLPKAA